MKENKFVIYKVTNLINNKCYIGKTTKGLETRMKAHLSNLLSKDKINYAFYNAIRKYGRENFSWEVIDTGNTDEELCKKERLWISQLNTKTPHGYNLTSGGDGVAGYKPKKEPWNKGKMGVMPTPWNKGLHYKNPKNGEHMIGKIPWNKGIKGSAAWNKGLKGYKINRSEIERQKQSLRSRGENNCFAKLNAIDVYKIKQMIRNGYIGKDIAKIFNVTPTTISGIKKGIIWKHINIDITNEELSNIKIKRQGLRGELNPKHTKIVCLTTGKIYGSITDAALEYNLDVSNISACCNGKTKSSGKLYNGKRVQWMYYDEYLHNGNTKGEYTNNHETRIICITTNEVFMRAKDGQLKYGIKSSSTMSSCLRGITKSAGKLSNGIRLKWMYLDDYLKQNNLTDPSQIQGAIIHTEPETVDLKIAEI